MRSSVSAVASTAPWPARAWSEWPCVISARSTARRGSMWKPPGGQHSPAGVETRSSWGRMPSLCIEAAPQSQFVPMSAPTLFLSSGDLLADRRYERARALEADGDLAAAADLLAQALERAPGFVSAWFALGEVRAYAGDRAGAVAAFRSALAADPADRHGAALRLARLGAVARRHRDGAREPDWSALVRPHDRSRMRHRPCRRGVPRLLRNHLRRRSLARHGRGGAPQGPVRASRRERHARVPRAGRGGRVRSRSRRRC